VALESEAQLLRAGVRAGVLDPEKGTAALMVYSELKRRGANFEFGDFLIERGLISRVALDGLLRSQGTPSTEPVRTISKLGDFELHDLLGEGETGSVFRAVQTSTGRLVAIKILAPSVSQDPEALQRFLNEAYLCAKIKHPNLIPIYRVATCEGLYYQVMELVTGGSVRELLEREGRLSESAALALTADAAAGLSAAHAAGVLHRDVKPENMLLTAQGRVKIADLGIAGRVAASDNGAEFWGTAAYVAPEVVSGQSTNDPREDVYALGSTLFEMFAGVTPFLGTPHEILRLKLSVPAPDVRSQRSDIRPSVAALVARMMAKDPVQRLPSAASVYEMIERLRSGASASGIMKATGTTGLMEELAPAIKVMPGTRRIKRHPQMARPGAGRRRRRRT